MIMKKSVFVFALVLLTVSCLKMGDPESFASKEDIFTSETGLNAYANSFYQALPTLTSIPVSETSTVDYAACRGSFSAFYCENAFTAETVTSWSWTQLRSINHFLDGLHSVPSNVNQETKDHYEGVARWFRAYFYYDKLAKYGRVPWFDHCLSNSEIDEMYKNRDSRDVIIGHIIEDLDFAYAHIQTEESVCNTLISKYAALALKSRVCLFEASWRKYHGEEGTTFTSRQLYNLCIDACKKLIGSGKFQLNTTVVDDDLVTVKGAYRSLFYSKEVLTNEVILGVQASKSDNVMGDANWRYNSSTYGDGYCLSRAFIHTYLCTDGIPFTTKYANYSTQSYKTEFNSRDSRLKQTVIDPGYTMYSGTHRQKERVAPDIVNSVAPTGYHPIKFVEDDKDKNNKGQNENSYPIIRYAEVLLNYAEALAETGVIENADWQATVGAIRKRSSISATCDAVIKLPTTIDVYLQQTFYPDVTNPIILEIRRERAIELVYEGFRVNDLNRWKEGECLEKVPWTGIHFAALDKAIDINEDGASDYYFTEKDITAISGRYKNIYVKVLPATTPGAGLKYIANPNGGYDLRYDTELHRKWYNDDRQYLWPIPAQIVREYANKGYVIDQNPVW